MRGTLLQEVDWQGYKKEGQNELKSLNRAKNNAVCRIPEYL